MQTRDLLGAFWLRSPPAYTNAQEARAFLEYLCTVGLEVPGLAPPTSPMTRPHSSSLARLADDCPRPRRWLGAVSPGGDSVPPEPDVVGRADAAAGSTFRPQPLPCWPPCFAVATLPGHAELCPQGNGNRLPGTIARRGSVVPPRAGIIISVAVYDGDMVRAGDPMLKVADERMSVAGTDIDANVRRALTQQRDLQLGQIALEEATTESEQKRLRERIEGLNEECQALGDQLTMQQGPRPARR